MTKYSPPTTVPSVVGLAKALADESRLRILLALRQSELCVCELTEMLDLAPSTVSKHLSILRQAGLAESRKLGRWVHVRRPELEASDPRMQLLRWIDEHLGASEPTVHADCCRLEEILARATEEG